MGARGREPPVVCRPIDKQRRYCKCIGTTRCGASLAAFLRDAKRRAPVVVYEIDSPIVRRSILSYRLSKRGRNNHRNASALYSSALTPISRSPSLLPFSFFFAPFSFSVCEESAAVRLSRRSAPASFMRSRPPSHPRPSSRFRPRHPHHSPGMMDLHGGRRRTENNKAGHAIQARMQRNYTPISRSLGVCNRTPL